jgi:hypothetical protein
MANAAPEHSEGTGTGGSRRLWLGLAALLLVGAVVLVIVLVAGGGNDNEGFKSDYGAANVDLQRENAALLRELEAARKAATVARAANLSAASNRYHALEDRLAGLSPPGEAAESFRQLQANVRQVALYLDRLVTALRAQTTPVTTATIRRLLVLVPATSGLGNRIASQVGAPRGHAGPAPAAPPGRKLQARLGQTLTMHATTSQAHYTLRVTVTAVKDPIPPASGATTTGGARFVGIELTLHSPAKPAYPSGLVPDRQDLITSSNRALTAFPTYTGGNCSSSFYPAVPVGGTLKGCLAYLLKGGDQPVSFVYKLGEGDDTGTWALR